MKEYKDVNKRVNEVMNMKPETFKNMFELLKPQVQYFNNIDKLIEIKKRSGLGDKRVNPFSMFIRSYLIQDYSDIFQKKIVSLYTLFNNNEMFYDFYETFDRDIEKIANIFNTTENNVNCKLILDEYREKIEKKI